MGRLRGRTMQDHAGRKGVKGLSLVGHEEVPRGFGLRTGDSSSNQQHSGGAGDVGDLPSRARITGRNRESNGATHFYFFP